MNWGGQKLTRYTTGRGTEKGERLGERGKGKRKKKGKLGLAWRFLTFYFTFTLHGMNMHSVGVHGIAKHGVGVHIGDVQGVKTLTVR
jgi:hypothetical protein